MFNYLHQAENAITDLFLIIFYDKQQIKSKIKNVEKFQSLRPGLVFSNKEWCINVSVLKVGIITGIFVWSSITIREYKTKQLF